MNPTTRPSQDLTPGARLTGPSSIPAIRAARAARPTLAVLLLVLVDLLAVVGAVVAGFGLRTLWLGHLHLSSYLALVPAVWLFPLAYWARGLYPGFGVGPVEELRELTAGTTVVYAAVAAASFMFKAGQDFSRAVLGMAYLFTLVLVPLARATARHLCAPAPWWGWPAVVLGAGRTGELLVRKLVQAPGLGLRPVALLDDDPRTHGRHVAGVPVLGALNLATDLATQGIRVCLVALPGVPRLQLLHLLEQHASRFPILLVVPDLFGLASLPVAGRDIGGVLTLEVRQNLLLPTNRWVKRAIDVCLALPLLALALPIILLAALAVMVLSPGSPFYSQAREGLGGRGIRVWKIRTMVPDAERRLRELLARDPAAQAEWEKYMKLRHDPRLVPVVGCWMRRLSLDELPQLWNVLRGEMSLVGPRPFPEYHLARFSPAFRELRRRVLPGITGLWQVAARSDGDLEVQEALDTYYIRNWSIWLDFYILARTIWVVLFGKGAY